jgi:hypothetical protein
MYSHFGVGIGRHLRQLGLCRNGNGMAGMGMARQNTGMAGMEILEASFRGEISIPKYYKNKIFLEKKGQNCTFTQLYFLFSIHFNLFQVSTLLFVIFTKL